MGATGSKDKLSARASEALLAFDTTEIESLKEKFMECASKRAPNSLMDSASLKEAAGLRTDIAERLFLAIAKAGVPGGKQAKTGGVSFDDFAVAVAQCTTATRYTRREFWLSVMENDDGALSRATMKEFFIEEVSSALPAGSSEQLLNKLVDESVQQAFDGVQSESMSRSDAETWLKGQPKAEAFFAELITSKFLRPNPVQGHTTQRIMPKLSKKSLLLQEEHLWTIAGHMPPHCLNTPWKQLFSSVKHGKSFSRFMAKIVFKGPTVVVVRDKGGHVFGMFAPNSWRKHNKFYGESTAFLFSVAPKCKVYPSSGVNQNFMFLSTTLTSCANGLGMGGQMDFWGIHLDKMLEEGVCRAPCSSFVSIPCLSSDAKFLVDQVEVWGCIADYVADEKEIEAAGVKKKPKKSWDDYANGGKTCLDNKEANAILDAAGRTNYSADVRAAEAVMDKERKAAKIAAGGDEDSDSDEEFEYDSE